MKKLPFILALVLYLLIYLLRFQQGGWEVKIDLFRNQRQAIDTTISAFLPSPSKELLSGILLGQNKNLPGRLRIALRDSSTLHIVVASGQNLSMVAGFFLALSGLIKRRTAIFLSLLAAVFYAVLTGFQVPVIRAAIMFSLASFAGFFGRKSEGLLVLIITSLLMLLVNPRWLFDLSFQLSFLATFGVIVLAPVLLQKLRFLPIIGQDLAVTMGAQLMVLPIIAQNFHQISLVSLFANLLVLWTIPFIMIAGVLMVILGSIFTGAGHLLALGVNGLLTYFSYIVEFFAGLPFAWEYVGEQSILFWVGYYFVIGGVVLLLKNGQREDSEGFKGSSF